MGNCYSIVNIAEDHIHTDITCSIVCWLVVLGLTAL